jgi:hypothetical protein
VLLVRWLLSPLEKLRLKIKSMLFSRWNNLRLSNVFSAPVQQKNNSFRKNSQQKANLPEKLGGYVCF